MRCALVLVAAALATAPATPQAQLSLGLRVAYAPAAGSAFGGFRDADTGSAMRFSLDLKSQVPVQLDVLYRLLPDLAAGAYASYGFGQVAPDALDGACMAGSPFECSATVVRAGLQVLYTLSRTAAPVVPWVGAGAGWEWTTLEASRAGRTLRARMDGLELLDLQLGVDYRATPRIGVGPYVGYSFGWYRVARVGDLKGLEVSERALHSWISLGLRGQLDL
jgi:hypothetical protein